MKLLVRTLLLSFAALVLLAGAGWYWLNTSLPELSGTKWLPGLSQPTVVIRDEHGIPTIRATNTHDAYFALGFVHAQDRLWQMERTRRLGAGRLSEILGEKALRADRFMRAMGFSQKAESTLHSLRPEVQDALTAYSDGVNAWMAENKKALPPEFVFLRYSPEPWKPSDSLYWGQLMALKLAGNWRDELLRSLMMEKLSPDQVDQLWLQGERTLPADFSGVKFAEVSQQILEAMPDAAQPITASNIWALAPSRTDTGGALLANDPHLNFDAPVLWYLVKIESPDLNVSGATVPGVPFHVLGHNETIAWGMTTTTSDTQDIFIERLTSDGGYDTPDGPKPFETRLEVIKVRDAAPQTFKIRKSRHGPVVSDFMSSIKPIKGHVLTLAMASMAGENLAPQALYDINRSTGWDTFKSALRSFHAPQLNIFFADINGNIGFVSPARVPIRKAGNGSLPVSGWGGAYDWVAWIPFEQLPHAYNPKNGVLVNANNKIVTDSYPHLLSFRWPSSYRARRITEMLDAHPRHVDLGMSAMQMDFISLMALETKPLLRNIELLSKRDQQAADMIDSWDGAMDRNRPEPLIFNAWFMELKKTIFADELGPLISQWHGSQTRAIRNVLLNHPIWCDNITTSRTETCAGQIGLALERALAGIEERQGDNMARWKWGNDHQARFQHTLFRHIPYLSSLTELSIPTNGGEYTVSRGTFTGADSNRPFSNVHGAGFRAVYNMADLKNSRFIIGTGQSGNPLSPHYGDLMTAWRNGQSLQFGGTAVDRLILQPIQ